MLASASPRRRDLLAAAGLAFEVRAAAVDEEADPLPDPAAHAVDLAVRKARAIAASLPGDRPAVILGADTVVALPDGRRLGKPGDEPEAAAAHLRALSGTTHRVITGVVLIDHPGGAEERFAVETRVTMRALSDAEIAAYAASGEGADKAGGYAIQETGDRFVVALEGSRSNVVGLPVEAVVERLARRGVRP